MPRQNNRPQSRVQTRSRRQPTAAADPHAALLAQLQELTPVQQRGDYWFKRDDLFEVNGVPGGKVRTCLALALQGTRCGLVTAGSRASPQVNIVAHVAQALGLPARCHTPQGELSPEVEAAAQAGAELVQHKAGHNSVIIARAREDAARAGWTEIPFGMECEEAVRQTRAQVANLPQQVQRVVMPVGSGMSLAGVLWGLQDAGRADVQVLGVQVGADPSKRLAKYAPPAWRKRVQLVKSELDYHDPAVRTMLEGVALDPYYEAKCLPHVRSGDLLWVVGIRATERRQEGPSLQLLQGGAEDDAPAVWMDPRELKPWPHNPRDNAAAVSRVRASIQRFGFGAPVVARKADLEIIAGHTRVLAAIELGLKRIPVRLLDITAEDAHKLAIADNRFTELTGWTEQLGELLREMPMPEVQLLGWSEAQLQELLRVPELPDGGSELASGEDADDERSGTATFGLYSWERIADAHVAEVLGHTHDEYFALSLADVMCELNKCAAGGKPKISLTDRWFPHRYDILCGKAPATPNQSLRDPQVIRDACEWLAQVKGWPNTRYLLRTLMLFHGRLAARQFPVHVARDIYRKYSKPGDSVLDPCAGWGGRLLGWHSTQHGGSYHGVDAGAATCAGHARMIADLGIPNAQVQHSAFEDVALRPRAYDFAFTSPPYFTVELYGNDPQQSTQRYGEYDAWRTGFLQPLVHNTLAALRPGAAFVLNVSDAGKYVIAADVQEIGRAAGAQVEAAEKIDIGAGSTGGLAKATAMVEDLVVLRKPQR